jgi:WD40 repeat protein
MQKAAISNQGFKVKAYKKKLKRHKDAVLTIHSPNGIDGGILLSGSADDCIKIWDIENQKNLNRLFINRPDDEFLLKYTADDLPNYAEEHVLNTEKVLKKQREQKNVWCFCFYDDKTFTGYEDGLICCYDVSKGELINPLIGHTNRINSIIATDSERIFSASNDCTIRSWSVATGVCETVYKFTDPISSIAISLTNNVMYTASWDKMVRVVDMQASKVTKSFLAAKEAIKVMIVHENTIFVAGCDPVIRSFNLETGDSNNYEGHEGWVYWLAVYDGYLFSGGDDKTIKIWDIVTAQCVEELKGHENGVTCLAFANNELFSGSFDYYIIWWDLHDIQCRIRERAQMRLEDIASRKIEVYNRTLASRKKPKKGKKGKKK